MFIGRSQLRILAIIGTLNLCVPYATYAGPPAEIASTFDVALTSQGQLSGVLIDNSGGPVGNVEVALLCGSNLVGLTTTDGQGRFALEDVQGGSYQLATVGSVYIVRAWASNTAPPVARPAAVIVVDGDVIRGQEACGCGADVGCCDGVGCGDAPGRGRLVRRSSPNRRRLLRWMRANPGIVLTGVAAAIAVPIAFIASDDDAS